MYKNVFYQRNRKNIDLILGFRRISPRIPLANFILSIFFAPLVSHAQFTLTGEIRPRTEFRDGYKTLNTSTASPAFFTEQRSRLYFSYQKEKIEFELSFQDVRIWGNAAQVYKTDPALTNVYEAWAAYHFNKKASLKIGRQALSYDNERFLGAMDWAQQGRSHDALKFMYADSLGFMFHAGAAFNQNIASEPTKLSSTFYSGVANYKTMQYIWLHKNWKTGKLSFLVFNDGRQKLDSTTVYRQTYGIYAERKAWKSNLHAELYYQGGRNQSSTKINAYMASLSAAFPGIFASPEIGADYLSGTGISETKDKAFEPSFGTNHKFYGFMDYFYVNNPHAQNGKTVGLVNVFLQTKVKASEKSIININLHQFYSPVSVMRGTEKLSACLGQEVDLVYNLGLLPAVNFKIGYSRLFSTSSLETLKQTVNSAPNQWAWAMLSLKPVLFSGK